jgi:hypothetical protein
MEILNPMVSDPVVRDQLAPRPDTLDGKVVGYVYSYPVGSDRIPKRIDELLSAKYKLGGRVWYNKPYLGEPVTREKQDELAAQCDVLVVTLGG